MDMASDLNLDLPTIDDLEAAKIITCTIEGVLEPSDIAMLVEETSAPNVPSPAKPAHDIKKLRERHHSVARLIAQGIPQGMVAELSGYTSSHLSVLLGAPSMQELIAFYRAQNGNAAEVIGENLRRVGGLAVAKIEAKLEADGDIDISELVAIAKLGLDRSGHGPSQKVDHNHTHQIVAADRLEQLNNEARRISSERILPRPALPVIDNETGEAV